MSIPFRCGWAASELPYARASVEPVHPSSRTPFSYPQFSNYKQLGGHPKPFVHVCSAGSCGYSVVGHLCSRSVRGRSREASHPDDSSAEVGAAVGAMLTTVKARAPRNSYGSGPNTSNRVGVFRSWPTPTKLRQIRHARPIRIPSGPARMVGRRGSICRRTSGGYR
jgi:hypothetical protein